MHTTPEARASIQQLNPGLHVGGKDPVTSAIPCCLSESALSGSWVQELEPGRNSETLMWDANILTSILTAGQTLISVYGNFFIAIQTDYNSC